jgi:tetratricopeptide (TPR) repeat protein
VLSGQLALNQNKFDEARSLYGKALELDPSSADTWRMFGAIAWRRWRFAIDQESARAAIFPRRRLPSGYGKDLVDEGISNLQHALKLDPRDEYSMGYLAAFSRHGADLGPMAGPWEQRILEIRQEKQRLAAAGVIPA